MLPARSSRYPLFIWALLVFSGTAIMLVTGGYNMLLDNDPLWHVAAGDLIRQAGEIPIYDPWSFTAGDYRWLNVSWLWDVSFSYIVEHYGWASAAAVNALTIAALLSLIYTHCLMRSGNGMASFITLLLLFIILLLHLRPLHITHLMVALWMLILGLAIRKECNAGWLLLLPVSMLLWVNSHGGFVLGFVLLGAFTLQSLWQKNFKQAQWMILTSVLSALAILCNPNGPLIIETVMRALFSVANNHITEWLPVTFNHSFMIYGEFVILFVALVIGRTTHATPAEKWLAYAFLIYGLTTSRAVTIFTIIAAPMLAYRLAYYFKESQKPTARALAIREKASRMIHSRNGLLASAMLAISTLCVLPSPAFLQHFPQQTSWPKLTEEIAYIKQYHPDGHFITDFHLGGYIIYETRGGIPTFIDARAGTAFPVEVMQDYFDFYEGKTGWDAMLDRYQLDGAIVANMSAQALHDRLTHRRGWKKAFVGDTATIYVRTPD